MKTNRKIVIGLIAFVLALACVFAALSFSTLAYAAKAKTPAPDASIKKEDYKTTDRKPTYTATLNENNKLLKTLEEKINGQNGKKENKALSFTKKYGGDIVNQTFSVLNMIKKGSSGSDVDWANYGLELAQEVIVSIASCYGFGGIASGLFTGFKTLFTNGEPSLSEIDILTDNMNRQFSQISDQLYDIEEQIAAVSDEVQKATNKILEGTSSMIENLDAKQIVRAFMSRGEGNFSYSRFRNYIYGSTRGANTDRSRAYYNHLIESAVTGADHDTIKYYYDQLFNALQSDIVILGEYYYGDVAGLDKSITKYYYDYLSANPSLVPAGQTPESMAIDFAYDIYSTYVYAYEIIKLCYSFQISEMFIEESLKGRELNDQSYYLYTQTDRIYYRDILSGLTGIADEMEKAEESVVSDLSYILNMGGSYLLTDEGGKIHEIVEFEDTFGNVADHQTIYLNKIPDAVISIFELDASKFSYLVNGTDGLAHGLR